VSDIAYHLEEVDRIEYELGMASTDYWNFGGLGYPTVERQNTLLAAIRALRDELIAARAEIAIDDQLLAERNRILDALPCPEHGPCVPYVLEWIATHLAADSRTALPDDATGTRVRDGGGGA
jgi:hypothetical protein